MKIELSQTGLIEEAFESGLKKRFDYVTASIKTRYFPSIRDDRI